MSCANVHALQLQSPSLGLQIGGSRAKKVTIFLHESIT